MSTVSYTFTEQNHVLRILAITLYSLWFNWRQYILQKNDKPVLHCTYSIFCKIWARFPLCNVLFWCYSGRFTHIRWCYIDQQFNQHKSRHKKTTSISYFISCMRHWIKNIHIYGLMDKYIYAVLYWECDYLSVLGLKLTHDSKMGPWVVCCVYFLQGHSLTYLHQDPN